VVCLLSASEKTGSNIGLYTITLLFTVIVLVGTTQAVATARKKVHNNNGRVSTTIARPVPE
jgi:hypothetical protein